jgi:flagellar basal-body rod protein FlgF
VAAPRDFSHVTVLARFSALARDLQNSWRAVGLGEPEATRRDESSAWEGGAFAEGSQTMENMALIGLSRQIVLHRELEVVANNIANMNTTGFKADGAVFEEYLSPVARHGHFRGNDARMSYVQDRATWHDFKQGALLQTGNPLDVAIDGDGFLVVQTPRGERYTRNGSLQINAAGQLVTTEGYAVMGQGGPIQFLNTDNSISIAPDGTIRVREGSNTRSDSFRGQLRVVRFEESARLQKDGSSLFSPPDGALPQAIVPPQRFKVVQGSLEQSNVNAVLEMSRMVELTRTYTSVASLLSSHGDMRRNAIDKLADVPA